MKEYEQKIIEMAAIMPRLETKVDKINEKLECLEDKVHLSEKEIAKLSLWKKIFIGLISVIGTTSISIFVRMVFF